MAPDDVARLRHILDALHAIARDIGDRPFERWMRDGTSVQSVLFSLAIIGEAAGRLTEQTRARKPAVRWNDIIGLRNIIIHEYFGVDYRQVWDTIHVDLPEFRQAIQELLD